MRPGLAPHRTTRQDTTMSMYLTLAKRFFVVMLFVTVIVVFLGVLSLQFLGLPPPAFAAAFPPIVGAWDAGKRYMQDHDAPPEELEAWKINGFLLLIFICSVVALFSGALAARGVGVADLMPFLQPAIFFTVMFWAIMRLVFWFGTRAAA